MDKDSSPSKEKEIKQIKEEEEEEEEKEEEKEKEEEEERGGEKEEKEGEEEKEEEGEEGDTDNEDSESSSPVSGSRTPSLQTDFEDSKSFYKKNDPLYIASGLTNDELKMSIKNSNKKRDDVITETKFSDSDKSDRGKYIADFIKKNKAKYHGGSQSDKGDLKFLPIMLKLYAVQLVGESNKNILFL